MKLPLLALAAGSIFIGVATQSSFAQPYPQGRGDSAQYGQNAQLPPASQDAWPEGPWRRQWRGGYAQNGPNENEPSGVAAGAPPPPRHRPPPPDAARFVFQRGPARIAVTCPQVFALQDCIQAAGELLDKIHSLRDGAAHPRTGGAPGSAAPSPSGGGPSLQRAPSVTPPLVAPNRGADNRM